MTQQSSSPNTDLWSLPSGNTVLFCLSVWALPLELALHRNFGRRYIGWHLVIAAVWPIFFSTLVRPDADPSWANGAFWVVMLLGAGHKSRAVELEKKGPDRHSGYSGEPWLGQLLRANEVSWKVLWEPLLCIAAGLVLMGVS